MVLGLPFQDQSFDYIHARLLSRGIPTDRWPSVLAEYHRLLRPNGILELFEIRPYGVKDGVHGRQIVGWLQEATKRMGIEFGLLPQLGAMGETADLRLTHQYHWVLPQGSWGGKAGELWLAQALE